MIGILAVRALIAVGLLIVTSAPVLSSPRHQEYPRLPVCPGEINICRVERDWNLDDLRARLGSARSAVWAEGDELSFAYWGNVESVRVCCGVQDSLDRVGESDLWVLTLRIRDLSQAVISYSFISTPLNPFLSPTPSIWRGEDAPPPPTLASSLRGQVRARRLQSAALGETRNLAVYLPPGYEAGQRYPVVYVADGQSVSDLVLALEPLIVSGAVPPVVLIGVHSPMPSTGHDRRADEYLPGFNAERFAAHERFFTQEVRQWAEANFGASTEREGRAVFGYSNGGVFAAAMGIRHAELYAHVLVFSPGVSPGDLPGEPQLLARFYLLAGTLEEAFHRNMLTVARQLRLGGAEVEVRERVMGHDFMMWQAEFPAAVAWAFAEKDA